MSKRLIVAVLLPLLFASTACSGDTSSDADKEACAVLGHAYLLVKQGDAAGSDAIFREAQANTATDENLRRAIRDQAAFVLHESDQAPDYDLNKKCADIGRALPDVAPN